MSWIRRFFETLRYVPGYYRVFFIYLSIILLVFIYVVFFHNKPMMFVAAAVVVIYSGLGVPIVVQNAVGKLSRSMGWWAALVFVLVGLFLVLRLLVLSDLLDTDMGLDGGGLNFSGLIYWANVYGIIWTAMFAGAGVVNMALHHGASGIKENLKRDFQERLLVRRLTKGEPLILDKRTVVLVIMAIAFTAGILALRGFLVLRPDLITDYTVPTEVSADTPAIMTLMLSNKVNRPMELLEVKLTGYFRYPAFINYTDENMGKDMVKLARSIPIISRAFELGKDAPSDTILITLRRQTAGNIKEVLLDFTRAYESLGLYVNSTAHQMIPSKFIVQWDRREKRLHAVWVGTPGIPFMKVQNATRLDGRGRMDSLDPYEDILLSGKIELRDVPAGGSYGLNLTVVYHPWLKGEFLVVDSFFVANEVVLEGGKPRHLVDVEVKKAQS